MLESTITHLYNQQKLLADISQLLIRADDLYTVINHILKLLGEHTNVSRVYIFENTPDGIHTNNTYEWCNEGITPQIGILKDQPWEIIPTWKQIMTTKGRIFSDNINELPEDIREVLAPQGIKSILSYPLYVENWFFGFIGFDECVRTKIWREDEMDLLRTVSNLLSNAFERKVVHDKLKLNEIRLKFAIDAANEGLWEWYSQTGEVYFSDTWSTMLGFEPGDLEISYDGWAKLVHPDDYQEVVKQLSAHIKGETEFYEVTYRLRTKSGEYRWILDHGRVVQRDENNNAVRMLGTHIDVTKQKEIEQQLKESIETKNILFYIISHDLRGPVGDILAALEFMTSGAKVNDETKNKFLEEMKKSSRTTYSLLENLLNWAKLQTNSIKVNPGAFKMHDIIDEGISLITTTAKQKDIQIEIVADPQHSVYADKELAGLVVRNLVSNAIKFTPRSGKIMISVERKGKETVVEVADTGVGMEKKLIDKILTSAGIYSTRGTENEKGSGIGLVLVKNFVEKNKGRLRFVSHPGKGTRAIFTLPSAE